jgi:hypothetical protein
MKCRPTVQLDPRVDAFRDTLYEVKEFPWRWERSWWEKSNL